jgi:hypothetical protein
MNTSTKRNRADWKLERFRSLRAEFSTLLNQFRETEDHNERLRLMESAHRVIDEARYVIEQYRQGLREQPDQQVIEIGNRKTNRSKPKHATRNGSADNVVAFRLHPTASSNGDSSRDVSKTTYFSAV